MTTEVIAAIVEYADTLPFGERVDIFTDMVLKTPRLLHEHVVQDWVRRNAGAMAGFFRLHGSEDV